MKNFISLRGDVLTLGCGLKINKVLVSESIDYVSMVKRKVLDRLDTAIRVSKGSLLFMLC